MVCLKIERKKVSEQIYHHIKHMIKIGEYKPGDKLPPETKLAEIFGVSRSPVREALRVLEASGIILARQGGGSVVQPISITNLMEKTTLEMINLDEVLDLLEVRMMLESETAALAANRRHDEDLILIETALNGLRNTVESKEAIGHEHDILFHTAIVKASHNRVLQQTMDGISNLYYKAVKFSLIKNVGFYEKRRQVLKEHEDIAKAIRIKDPKLAKDAMQLHLSNAKEKLKKYVSKTMEGN